MYTYANITVDAGGRGATLTEKGRQLRATISASTGAGRFTAVDLNITSLPNNQTAAFNESPGLRKLVFETVTIANIEVTLQLQPL